MFEERRAPTASGVRGAAGADRFRIVRTGSVALDLRAPGRSPSSSRRRDTANSSVAVGTSRAGATRAGRVVARRLHATRVRLLDLYGPCGSGERV
ncbi:hypothetical protein [Streptomyces sp. NPDC051452]|uniref:hypothetical protein n=1 Tax=Streptomyces sp. NPDC051452 TaxID=3365654 RepID=UPI00378CEB49